MSQASDTEIIDEYKDVIEAHHADFRRIKDIVVEALANSEGPHGIFLADALREIAGIVR